ncbi:hypothetical protein IV417_09935 [Alphaproteobacteria bacterium KMM 3653]|uniref:DUF2157 domain-containing protein n=1 Tax=Harenicola maris TaxID=2841044 RepID=A0AAP2CNI6_9RHOB|nr:hypothetical protein [Harenicola maris]
MSLTRDDIRAAVAMGTINEGQAAQILALSDSRRGHRENLQGQDEPFELFKGFNEIFIVVGLSILYAGWSGIIGFTGAAGDYGPQVSLGLHVLSLVVASGLAAYFTLRRRMVAPSIALAIMFAISALWLGLTVASFFAEPRAPALSSQSLFVGAAFSTVLTLAYWFYFRVPFALLLVAIGVFATLFNAFVLGGAEYNGLDQVFRLSASGPFAFLTIGLGVLGFIIALMFDMTDPHRVTRRAANGFWLHIIAAPAIVNTVSLTFLASENPWSLLFLMGFLAVMALLAIVIDRRSFLVSGVGYVVAVAITVAEDGAFIAVFFLGVGLVLLGAFWEQFRRFIMNRLPAFPGKTRLPPWQAPQEPQA